MQVGKSYPCTYIGQGSLFYFKRREVWPRDHIKIDLLTYVWQCIQLSACKIFYLFFFILEQSTN